MIPKQTDDIILSGELNILEAMAKTYMRYGQNLVYHKVGPMGQNAMMCSNTTHASSLTRNFPRWKKNYDRDTTVGTLKLIGKLGFKITKE